jgi:GT2 family glycosyltransferase
MDDSNLNVSIVIPVYNGGKSFERCLNSIKKFGKLAKEIIVVADGDTDGSRDLAKQFGAKVLTKDKPSGPAHARNLGAKLAQGDIILFIDADVEILSDTLTKVVQAFQQKHNLAAIIGSYDDDPGAKNFLSQYKNLIHHYTHQKASPTASTFWGACGAIRRDVFFAVGGFNTKYRSPSIEDIELGYRLRQQGYDLGLFKDIQVKHLKQWTTYSLLKAEIFYRAIPWSYLIVSTKQFRNDLNLDWSNRVSVVLVYLFLLCLSISLISPPVSIVCLICLSLLLYINAPVYKFFYHKLSLLFALRTIPWHWLYYFYSGFSFVIGSMQYYIEKVFPFCQMKSKLRKLTVMLYR